MKTKWLNIPPRSLSYIDKWFFWRTILLALVLRILLKLVPFKTAVRFLKRFNSHNKNRTAQRVAGNELELYRTMIQMSYKFWPAINCLSTSLAFWFSLQKRDINTELRFGILKEGEKLLSHAWLEHDGSILSHDDRAVEKYKTFAKAIL